MYSLYLAALFLAVSGKKVLNPRPIVGVLSQWCYDSYECDGKGYVASSYVKYLQSAGAQVYVIPLATSDNDLRKLMTEQLSGFVLPGGNNFKEQWEYGKMSKLVWDLSTNGTSTIPVWGTCLGMEAMATYAKGSRDVADVFTRNITGLRDMGLPMVLKKKGRIFKNQSKHLARKMETALTYQSHSWSLLPENLDKQFKLITTSIAPTGEEFVSIYEHKKFPIWGSIWHPEKAAFEWGKGEKGYFIHNYDAIELANFIVQFFVEEARKHQNKWTLPLDLLAYNFKTKVLENESFADIYVA